MSFKLPKFLIKKIFPPKKSVFTVDTSGDGKADSLQVKALNMIQPFTIPESINLGEFNINDFDLSEYAQIKLDEEPIELSKDVVNINIIRERFKIYHKGTGFTIEEILSGKAGGRMIAVGDSLSVLIKLDDGDLQKLTEGTHTFSIEAENFPKIEIGFELTKKNMNQKLELKKA